MSDNKPPFKRTIFSQAIPSQAALMSDSSKQKGPETLQWDVTPEDMDTIKRIAQRLFDMADEFKIPVDRHMIAMEVACVHCNSCPLELWQLLASSGDDFSHDVLGINRFLDRKTGQLMNGFKPRFAKKAN